MEQASYGARKTEREKVERKDKVKKGGSEPLKVDPTVLEHDRGKKQIAIVNKETPPLIIRFTRSTTHANIAHDYFY